MDEQLVGLKHATSISPRDSVEILQDKCHQIHQTTRGSPYHLPPGFSRTTRPTNMCTQINNLFSCGHRSFKRYDNCPLFGQTCFGAGGNHKDEGVAGICKDCKFRESRSQSQTSTPGAGSPDSSGEGGRAVADVKDPWGEGDPYRRLKKG